TTYSALAADAAWLMGNGALAAGIGYGLATVVLGGLATWAGIAVAVATHRPTARPHEPIDPDHTEATPESPSTEAAPESRSAEAVPESRSAEAPPESLSTEPASGTPTNEADPELGDGGLR